MPDKSDYVVVWLDLSVARRLQLSKKIARGARFKNANFWRGGGRIARNSDPVRLALGGDCKHRQRRENPPAEISDLAPRAEERGLFEVTDLLRHAFELRYAAGAQRLQSSRNDFTRRFGSQANKLHCRSLNRSARGCAARRRVCDARTFSVRLFAR